MLRAVRLVGGFLMAKNRCKIILVMKVGASLKI